MGKRHRYTVLSAIVLLIVLATSLIGGWNSTNKKKSKVRPVTAPIQETQLQSVQSETHNRESRVVDTVVSAETGEITRPRFQRDRLWAPETPAEVFPFSSAHATEMKSTVDCVGGENPQSRTCRIYNACFDAELDNHGTTSVDPVR